MQDERKIKRPWLLSLLSVGLLFLLGCDGQKGVSPAGTAVESQGDGSAVRLVSLAPSITEIIFELGLGNRLVADTNYCVTPEAAKALPKVGAWTDVNVEQVLSFRPTHVCLAETHPKRRAFEALGTGTVPLRGGTLEDVLASIGQLGAVFHREQRAQAIVSGIRLRMASLRRRHQGLRPVRTLVMISRSRGEGVLRNMIVAGDDGYYSELLKLAGCEQIPQGLKVAYPTVSAEAVAAMDPELIVEIAPDLAGRGADLLMRTREDWRLCLPQLSAVKHHRILVFTETWAAVPGIRSVLFAEQLADRVAALRRKRP